MEYGSYGKTLTKDIAYLSKRARSGHAEVTDCASYLFTYQISLTNS